MRPLGPPKLPLIILAFIISILSFGDVEAIPDQVCPDWLKQSGVANDIATLSLAVGQEESVVKGTCGQYTPLHTVEGKYATRMRIYRAEDTGATFIAFRYTVQPEGEVIHNMRTMTPCTFLDVAKGCSGQVHEKFQEAFLSLMSKVDDWQPYINDRKVYVFGTSLGGALQLFMGLYLHKVLNVLPAMGLGLAGLSIGDEAFAKAYQYEYRDAMKGKWWQTEAIDIDNPDVHDNFPEGYLVQTEGGQHDLYIQRDTLCSFPIHPLPMPQQAFGMHDLQQYHLFLQGTDCSI